MPKMLTAIPDISCLSSAVCSNLEASTLQQKVLTQIRLLMKQSQIWVHTVCITVIPVLSGHSNIDKTKILMTNGSLIKVKSIAEYSPWSILQYF